MSRFRADCSRCCGLCCVVPAQLAIQGFPADKHADVACEHLDENQRCRIHAIRQTRGFSACRQFDCYGAGQWITQQLFGGSHWTASPALAQKMFSAYRKWAPRFEAAALIEAALPYVVDDARPSLVDRIDALTGGETPHLPGCDDAGKLRRDTLELIRSALEWNC